MCTCIFPFPIDGVSTCTLRVWRRETHRLPDTAILAQRRRLGWDLWWLREEDPWPGWDLEESPPEHTHTDSTSEHYHGKSWTLFNIPVQFWSLLNLLRQHIAILDITCHLEIIHSNLGHFLTTWGNLWQSLTWTTNLNPRNVGIESLHTLRVVVTSVTHIP